jgi:hypothetical protein
MRLILLAVIFLAVTGYSQQAPIAIVSTNGATKLVTTLDEAAQQAQDNDIIYIPAGSFAGTTFSKKVTVIGVGHHPDSASAAGRTEINGNIGFNTSGCVFDGAYVSGGVQIASNGSFYRINADHFTSPAGWANAENILISNCITRAGDGTGAGLFGGNQTSIFNSNSSISRSKVINSVIAGTFTSLTGANTFENCIFLISGAYGLQQAGNNIYRNCIFPNVNDWGAGVASATLIKCILATSSLPPLEDPGSSTGNIFSQSVAAIFENGSGIQYGYLNDRNYRLKSTSPGRNAGTDGKDIGIYGGSSPYFDFAIPLNPSVRTREISDTTSSSGTLRVKFNVRVN